MEEPEFKRGDIVTFNAYKGEQIKAKVINVRDFDESYGLYEYDLEGISKGLVGASSGRSLRESVHFIDPEDRL